MRQARQLRGNGYWPLTCHCLGVTAPSRSIGRTQCCAAFWLLHLAAVLSAGYLAGKTGRDRRQRHRFVISPAGMACRPARSATSFRTIRVFLWFNTQGVLSRYDGYKFKSYRRDPSDPNHPAAGFLQSFFKDRSGALWIGSSESLDRFDPVTETLTRYAIDSNGPRSVLGQVWHISEDRAGTVWLSYSDRTASTRCKSWTLPCYYSHDPANPGQP